MNKKKTIILLAIGILVVTILSIGVTYSYMKPKAEKENNQTEIGINNCAKITLKDNNSTINLTNMYPMEEEMGLQTTPYEFTISSTCEEYTGFNLYLLTYSENEIDDNLIRYGITSKNDTVLETNLITKEEASDISTKEIEEINQGVNKGYNKIYKIYSNNIPLKGESEYKLHIWIDENANNDTMNKNIKLGVIVKGYEREETMAEYLIAHKDNTLIYHDGKPDYEGMVNAYLEAEDYNYRYSGGNDEVNNYICFGGDCSNDPTNDNYLYLYRIIGLFDDDKDGNYNLKLIRADYATSIETGTLGGYIGNSTDSAYDGYKNKIGVYYWNTTYGVEAYDENKNQWYLSNLNKVNLNNYFLNTFLGKGNDIKTNPNEWQQMIENHTWITGGFGIWNNAVRASTKTVFQYELGDNRFNINDICDLLDNSKCTMNILQTKSYIGLMYVSDFVYAKKEINWNYSSTNNPKINKEMNWLVLNSLEWTITRYNDANHIYFIASNQTCGVNSFRPHCNSANLRQVFYLKTNVKKASNSGDGEAESPYIIDINNY